MLTASERAIRARIGAFALHASRDAVETTAKARAKFLERFEIEVDPTGSLPLAERKRRAEYARKAHFARLALESARKRSGQKKTAAEGTATVAAMTEVQVDATDRLPPS